MKFADCGGMKGAWKRAEAWLRDQKTERAKHRKVG